VQEILDEQIARKLAYQLHYKPKPITNMGQLVADCPRCGAKKTTFDVIRSHLFASQYNWQRLYEGFSLCRHCDRTTTFVLSQLDPRHDDILRKKDLWEVASLNDFCKVEGFVCLKNFVQKKPPEHLPADINSAFEEGATCLAVECFNASATMFRLCIDHATRALLPEEDPPGLNREVRRSLGLRLKWLFDNNKLPENLRGLSTCIKEDGNDGAHAGTLGKADAEDLLDFTYALLVRLYTEPESLRQAQLRRQERRKPKS